MLLVTAACLIAGASPSRSADLSGRVDLRFRGFAHPPAYPRQERNTAALVLQPEFQHTSKDGRDSFRVLPHLRLDSASEKPADFDVRELTYQHLSDSAELRVGIGRVFWGVVESYRLIDIVNQVDLANDIDGDEKLGQPLVNLSLIGDQGVVDLFVLPTFRERTFPGRKGRLRSQPPVDTDRAVYESGAGRNRIDYALRWSHAFDAVDIGLAHFHGTAREPRLVSQCAPPGCNPLTGEGLVLIPRYEVTRRTSLDLQITGDATLWKLEALHEARRGESWSAWVAGLEHTLYGILETDSDLAVLLEYLFDGRGKDSPQPFDDDIFLGVRLALNDAGDTDLLVGAVSDRDNGSTFLSVEASRRLDDRWTIELNARVWIDIERGDPFYPVRRDDHLQLAISRYF